MGETEKSGRVGTFGRVWTRRGACLVLSAAMVAAIACAPVTDALASSSQPSIDPAVSVYSDTTESAAAQDLAERKAAAEKAAKEEADAKAALDDAKDALSKARTRYRNAKAAANRAFSGIVSSCEEDVSAKEEAVADAKAAYEKAVEEKNELRDKIDEAMATYKAIKASPSQSERKAAMDAAKEKYDSELASYNSKKAAAEDAVDEAQEAYDKAGMNFIDENVQDAYKSDSIADYTIEASKTSAVIKNSLPGNGTKEDLIKAANEALSTDRIYDNIYYIEKCNYLRAHNDNDKGTQKALKIDFYLMNFSAFSAIITYKSHSHAFYSVVGRLINNDVAESESGFENVSWAASNENTEYGPYSGWFFAEKYYYDNDIALETGHYGAIMDPNFTATGLGYYKNTYAQRFLTNTYSDKVMTTSEFKQALDSYVATKKSALTKAKSTLESLQEEPDSLVSAREDYEAKKSAYESDQTLEEAIANVRSANIAYHRKYKEMTALKSEYDAAVSALDEAEAEFEAAKKVDRSEPSTYASFASLVEAQDGYLASKEAYNSAKEANIEAQKQYNAKKAAADAASKAYEDAAADYAMRFPSNNAKFAIGKARYRIVSASKRTVAYSKLLNKKAKKAAIPSSVKIAGTKYKVVRVDSKAFSSLKKLKTVTIGKNVSKLAKSSFYKVPKLKKITLKTKKLKTKKSVRKCLYKSKAKSVKVKVPKSVKKKCKRAFSKKNVKCKKIRVYS